MQSSMTNWYKVLLDHPSKTPANFPDFYCYLLANC
jgi:hypothetical protein